MIQTKVSFGNSDLRELVKHLTPKGWMQSDIAELFGHRQSWASKRLVPGEADGRLQVTPEQLEHIVALAELSDAPETVWPWFDKAQMLGIGERVACIAWRQVRSREATSRVASRKRPYELLLEMFGENLDPSWPDQVRAYLRGGQPQASIAELASVQRPDAERIFQRIEYDGIRRLLVHAPMGDGVSTVLLQVAAKLLRQGDKPVFLCRGELPAAPPAEPFILIIDDSAEVATWPDWLAASLAHDDRNRLVLGTRTFARRALYERLGSLGNLLDFALQPERADRTELYLALYRRFDACEEPERDIAGLFRDGLGNLNEPGSGGLWCAAYQATRGETFEDRFQRYVQALPHHTRHAVALLAFANMLTVGSQGHLPAPDQRLMRAFGQAALEPWTEERADYTAAVREEVGRLKDLLEGELLAAPLSPNQLLRLRHSRVTHVLFRYNFGSGPSRPGEVFLDKYTLYDPMLRALHDIAAPASIAHDLIFEAARVQHSDITKRGDHPKRDAVWRRTGLADELYGDVSLDLIKRFREIYKAPGETRARVDILESRIIADEERQPSADAKRAASEQVLAAVESYPHAAEVLSSAAHFAARYRVSWTGYDTPVWLDLMQRVVSLPDLSEPRRADKRREFLDMMLQYRPPGRLAKLQDLMLVSSFPWADSWNRNRLDLLLRAGEYVCAEAKGNQHSLLGSGSHEEPCGTTVRATLRDFLSELQVISASGRLGVVFKSVVRRQRFEHLLRRWASLEEKASDLPVWGAALTPTTLLQLLDNGDLTGLGAVLTKHAPFLDASRST